jgi:two-component system, cell cycle response regulator
MATSISTTQESPVRSLAHSLARSAHAPAVLLAAADPTLQADLQPLLRGWGHPVETVTDGISLLQALERPESTPFVILDADLPGLRGMTLLHRLQLQSTRRRSWTVLLTDTRQSGEAGDKSSAQDTGVDDVLTKPVDGFELRVSLRAASRVQARFAEMAEALEAASFHATHDSLTGLLNRESLLNLLFQETDRTQRLGSQLAFLLLDLDQFARVNREHGYDGGDRVLRQLASRFRRFLRSYDVTGRCGGDQFLVAMPGCTHEDARSMAARLRDCVAERPFDILQATISMTASIGIAQSGGRSPLTALREAEFALGRAKLAGGACARWFPSASLTTSSDGKQLVGLAASQSVAPREVDARSVPV